MALLNSFISWLMKKRIHQIELFMKYPHEVQLEWFRKLMNSASETEWGLKYGYGSIQTPEEFKKRVPVNDYNSLKPYIERLRHGEQNLLWNSEIKWFAKSSGTTNDKSKFIPVSQEALEECHFKGGKDLLSIYLHNNPESQLFDGKGLALGGSHRINEFNNDSYYGDLSAIIIQNLPFWAEFSRVPTRKIALMDEWEIKIEQMARATIEDNVTSLAGVPSWTLLLLKRILEITGKSDISEVWPNLELYFHGGVNFTPYREQFHNIIRSHKMNYVETYNATEGFFGIQDSPERNDMLLMLDYGIYYEFLPVENIGDEYPKTLGLEQVELDKNYALVISTNGGLWRYLIGDTVRFTCLSPYRIQITGRTKTYINAFGEELIEENAQQALTVACEKTGAIVNEYTAAPVFIESGKQACHEWIIEFEKKPENLGFFTEALDNALKSFNSDYEAKRYKNILLKEPLIHVAPKNTFYEWMKKRNKLGGQNKIPRLANDRKYIEEILLVMSRKP